MTSRKPRISLGDFASLWIAASCAIFVGSATYAVLIIDSDAVIRFASKPFYPGFYIASRLISGQVEVIDRMASVAILAAAVVNAFVYACGVLAIRLLWRYLAEPNSLRSDRMEVPNQSHEDH